MKSDIDANPPPRAMESGLSGAYSRLLLCVAMILELGELLFLLIDPGGKRLQKCGKKLRKKKRVQRCLCLLELAKILCPNPLFLFSQYKNQQTINC